MAAIAILRFTESRKINLKIILKHVRFLLSKSLSNSQSIIKMMLSVPMPETQCIIVVFNLGWCKR
jgi:hypothetical protein